MSFDVKDLKTYDNKRAAGLVSYALSRLESTSLGYDKTSEAFESLGTIFGIKPNTIKNFRDSFDPFTDSGRVGWHKNEILKPNYLNDILEYGKTLDDDELQEMASIAKSWVWLPDLTETWEACEQDLKTIPDLAELEVPIETTTSIASFLENKGLTVTNIGHTAISLKSSQLHRHSILSMAYLPKFKVIMPYVYAVTKYKSLADDLLDDLHRVFPSAENDQQKLFDAIRNGQMGKETFYREAQLLAGSNISTERLYKAFVDANWSGLNKSIFRGTIDVVKSVCQDRLELENEKTGYVSHIIDYLLDSGERLEDLEITITSTNPGVSKTTVSSDLPRNVLFFGAPGTGKSHNAEAFVPCGSSHLHRTVFFADYQNSDFIGGIKPVTKDDKVTYSFEPGPLTIALIDALQNPEENVALLIEEINRGNAPAIFGEMFHLLDRAADGTSKYPIRVSESMKCYLMEVLGRSDIELVKLPSNLFIIATMNAGDQGVFALDTAFKRRWHFKYMPIDFDTDYGVDAFSVAKITLADNVYTWREFAKAVNKVLVEEVQVPEDRLLGPFFLSPTELDAEDLTEAVAGKVLPYLWEDVLRYDDRTLLFDSNIRSFSQLQSGLKSGEQVFSDKFKNRLSNLVSMNNSPEENSDVQDEIADEEESPRGEILDEGSQ
ncbi:AAA family ATPase [bacterium]|nr:AAA family ATPase [bacterium]